MMMKNSQYFHIFGRVIKDDSLKVSFNDMNKFSYCLGIIVPESLCYHWLLDELLKRDIDYNSTFYKSWEDIQSKSRQELWLDQLKHYASTYGTNFQEEAWTLNDGDKEYFTITGLKVLEGVTKEEALSDIKQLAYSNIAFSNEVLDFLIEFKDQLEVDKIQNRTLKMQCIDENYQFKDGQECLNYILYKYFGIQMLVKNLDTLSKISSMGTNLGLEYLIKKNENILASVFYRNKDVFIRLKGVISPRVINRIRKLARKYHKPMPISIWLRINKISKEERQSLFDKTPIFKLVQMYNALMNPTGYYIIRNGKAFYKESKEREYVSYRVLQQLLFTIINKVPKVESVSLPKGISLAMPTSEKNFIGDIPLGSYVDCSDKNTMVGIYWKNDWGARDLDLHVKTLDGSNIGWNSEYINDGEILFSGDMTDAPEGASEVMWFKKEPQESIVSVCKYYGDDKYHYDMFIAQENATDFKKNYMVNPNNVVYKARIALEGKSDVTLGYFNDNKFVFHSCNVGNNIVPSKWRELILKHLVQCNYLQMSTVLEAAGIKVSDDSEIKLTSKGDLIKFFSAS